MLMCIFGWSTLRDLRCLFGGHKCVPFFRIATCIEFHCAVPNEYFVERFFKLSFITAPANPPSVLGQSYDSTSISVQWTFDNSTRNVLGVLQGFHIYYVRHDDRSFVVNAD